MIDSQNHQHPSRSNSSFSTSRVSPQNSAAVPAQVPAPQVPRGKPSRSSTSSSAKFRVWKACTINVRTAKCDQKLTEICQTLKSAKIDIAALQEVRRTGKDSLIVDGYVIHWSGMARKAERGVGIAVKNDDTIQIDQVTCIDERIMHADIRIEGFSVKVVSAYGPTEAGKEWEKSKFWANLSKIEVKKGQQLLILGDLNATTTLSLGHTQSQTHTQTHT